MRAIAQGLYQHNNTYYMRIRLLGCETVRSLGYNLDIANSIHSQTKPILSLLQQMSRTNKTNKTVLATYREKTLGLIEQLRSQSTHNAMDNELLKLKALLQNAEQKTRVNEYNVQNELGITKRELRNSVDDSLDSLDDPDIQEQIEERYIQQYLNSPEIQETLQEHPEFEEQIKQRVVEFALQQSQKETEQMRLALLSSSSRTQEHSTKITELEAKLARLTTEEQLKIQNKQPPISAPKKHLIRKMSEALEDYISQKSNTKQPLTQRNADEFRQSVEEVIDVLGNKSLDEYDTQQFREFEAIMLKVPARYRASSKLDKKGNPLKFYNKTIREISELGSDSCFGEYTISQKLQNIQSIYKHFQVKSPLDNFVFKTTPDNIRRNLKESEIQKLADFAATLPESAYWYVLCCMFTGARPNEISQLTNNDIRQDDDGIWYFDINDADLKKLKNKQSNRNVPIHSKLIDAGFLNYVKKIQGNIFSKSPKSSDWSNYASAYVIEPFLSENKIPKQTKEGNIVFYCLRHSFITYLINEKHAEVRFVQELVGHEQGTGTTKNYTHGQCQLSKLREELEKLYTGTTIKAIN